MSFLKKESVSEGRKWSMHVDGKKIKTYTSKRAAVIAHNKFMKDTDNWKEVSIQAESVSEIFPKGAGRKISKAMQKGNYKPEKRRKLKTGEVEVMKGKGSRQKWFYLKNKEEVKQLIKLGRNSAFPTGITNNNSRVKFDKGLHIKESVNESIQLPHGMKLGKVFTGHGKSFVKEESVNEDVGAETILGGIVQSIQKAGLKPKSAKLMKSGFKVSKRDKVGFVIDVEIRGFDKKEIHKMQFEVERGMLYLILNNKPVKLGKWTMGTMVTKNLKKIALTLSGQKGSPKRIA